MSKRVSNHSIWLRHGFTVLLDLPTDITQREADRLCGWIQMLVIPPPIISDPITITYNWDLPKPESAEGSG